MRWRRRGRDADSLWSRGRDVHVRLRYIGACRQDPSRMLPTQWTRQPKATGSPKHAVLVALHGKNGSEVTQAFVPELADLVTTAVPGVARAAGVEISADGRRAAAATIASTRRPPPPTGHPDVVSARPCPFRPIRAASDRARRSPRGHTSAPRRRRDCPADDPPTKAAAAPRPRGGRAADDAGTSWAWTQTRRTRRSCRRCCRRKNS